MTIFLPENEEIYRQNKQNSLKKTLQELGVEPEFIWIKEESRRRVIFQIDNKNNLGFFKEKTKELIEIDEYSLAEKSINLLIKPLKLFLKKQQVFLNILPVVKTCLRLCLRLSEILLHMF
jgi:tRNA/tmRNA/rRNA uracil-C5-methylase (TrmA/RlmC/RlmD family)